MAKQSSISNRSAPAGTVVAYLVYDDVPRAADWLCNAFGFRKRLHAGDSHAQLSIDGSGGVMLSKSRIGQGLAKPNTNQPDAADMRQPRPNEVTHIIHVHVSDVDAHHEHARSFGAKILNEPADCPFGERQYTVEDLAGHRWTFSQTIADVSPESSGAFLIAPNPNRFILNCLDPLRSTHASLT